jgi:hypothetical protein
VVSNSAGAAFSGAVGAQGTEANALADVPVHTGNDPALRMLVDVWGNLPDSAKNQILRLADDAVAAMR